MPRGVFRVVLPDRRTVRLAVGDVDQGPRTLLDPPLTIDALLSPAGPSLADAVDIRGDDVPEGTAVFAPAESQEIWAAGVTYLRSREARVEEAIEASAYDRVYDAERPELFFKSSGRRVHGPHEWIGIRPDSTWDVPEPELTLALDAHLDVVGYTIGNDVSSRSIEGENTLYLPQAKIYEGACALGPSLVPATEIEPPFTITMRITRGDDVVYEDSTSTDQMARTFEELAAYLGRALRFPVGALLMTGTGLVPDPPFTLAEGDVVTIAIDGLGTLRSRVRRLGVAATG